MHPRDGVGEQLEDAWNDCMEYYDDANYCGKQMDEIGGTGIGSFIVIIVIVGYFIYNSIKKANKK